jgi:hypothetical protein
VIKPPLLLAGGAELLNVLTKSTDFSSFLHSTTGYNHLEEYSKFLPNKKVSCVMQFHFSQFKN